MPPCPAARSTSSRIRCAFAGTSGSAELARKGTAILVSLTMVLPAALLCNYGRELCLIDVGTEGRGDRAVSDSVSGVWDQDRASGTVAEQGSVQQAIRRDGGARVGKGIGAAS